MKRFALLVLSLCAILSTGAVADNPSPVPAASPTSVAVALPVPPPSPTPGTVVVVSPTTGAATKSPPVPGEVLVVSPTGSATATPLPPTSEVVATPSAPPQWAQQLLVTAESLPVVGPVISKAMLWIGIIASVLTTLVATLIGITASLGGLFNATGLTKAATALAAFRDGKLMYYLKFFSLFNAKKPDPQV